MIRQLDAGDAASMAACHADGFYGPWDASEITDMLGSKGTVALGAFTGGALCGFIMIRTLAGQSDILTLVVRDAARGQGLGRSLLTAAEQAACAAGADVMFLEVGEDKAPAMALYQSAKYYRVGRRSAYYRRPHGRVDAIVMQKRLSPDAGSAS